MWSIVKHWQEHDKSLCSCDLGAFKHVMLTRCKESEFTLHLRTPIAARGGNLARVCSEHIYFGSDFIPIHGFSNMSAHGV